MNKQKLVLFDLDGTLIRPLRPIEALQRFRIAIRDMFGKDIGEITKSYWSQHGYNGQSDRYILWGMLKDSGISRDAFVDNLGAIGDKFVEYLDALQGDRAYEAIPDAQKLVDLVIKAEHLSQGVLTGNLIQSAGWKVRYTGYPSFAFGVFGNEGDDRIQLAQLVIPKAKEFFGHTLDPKDIIFVGDTVNDILCARAIGSPVIIAATGWDVSRDELEKAKPDLLVDSLMDERVLKLLGLAV